MTIDETMSLVDTLALLTHISPTHEVEVIAETVRKIEAALTDVPLNLGVYAAHIYVMRAIGIHFPDPN